MLTSLMLLAAAANADAVTWLCRPARRDACAPDPTRTVVSADGSTRIERVAAASAPDADCFYVYPTASSDPTANSDRDPGIEEEGQAASQFAAFAGVCRTFAPVYRQVTLTALRAALADPGKGDSLSRIKGDWDLAYRDVRAAWRAYLAHDNRGRPFVLIGHSQGSLMLKRLVAEEIDGMPVARRMLSAILPGTAVMVPKGKDVGGDFKVTPLCRSERQTGCVVTWASYRDAPPPPPTALFGRDAGGLEAGCTNPARLAGGEAPLDAILGFPWWRDGVVQYKRSGTGWSVAGRPLATRYARMPGLLSARCVSSGGLSYLAVHVGAGGFGGLKDATTAPATVGDAAYPEWGWHVMDVPIVQGDLIRLVRTQTAAWVSRRGSRRP